jgi:hypothetical protein
MRRVHVPGSRRALLAPLALAPVAAALASCGGGSTKAQSAPALRCEGPELPPAPDRAIPPAAPLPAAPSVLAATAEVELTLSGGAASISGVRAVPEGLEARVLVRGSARFDVR